MGMSASQARYLALTARMNDIEYQGQQINQQRTTLANQINELYNSLLDIDVPTPPSTKDFTKLVYSGNYNSSKFSIGTVTPGSTQGTYNIDFNYTNTGHYWSKGETVTINRGKSFYEVQTDWPNKMEGIDSTESYKLLNPGEKLNAYTIENPDVNLDISGGKGDVDVYIELTAEQYNQIKDKLAGAHVYEITNPGEEKADNYILNEVEDTSTLDSSKKYMIQVNVADLAQGCGLNEKGEPIDDDDPLKAFLLSEPTMYTIQDSNGNDLANHNLVPTGVETELTQEMLDAHFGSDYMVSSTGGTGAHSPSVNDFTLVNGELKLKEGLQIGKKVTQAIAEQSGNYFTHGSDSDTKVGRDGKIDLNMDITENFLTDDFLATSEGKAYLDGLKNAFPKIWRECNGDVKEFLSKFAYYYTEKESTAEQVPHVVLKSDLTGDCKSVKSYEYMPNGTYTSTQNEEGCKLEFGSDGRITSVGFPTDDGWAWVDVAMTEETDTDAYEEAFHQYEYDKYKYDKKQQEINAKTSIIQQEDKNLELKLTRLDNERNAVNTELEAVKKVIGDNIDKSFKTFSG